MLGLQNGCLQRLRTYPAVYASLKNGYAPLANPSDYHCQNLIQNEKHEHVPFTTTDKMFTSTYVKIMCSSKKYNHMGQSLAYSSHYVVTHVRNENCTHSMKIA